MSSKAHPWADFAKRASGLRAMFLGLAMLASAPAAMSAELVMFERRGCAWCLRWDKEVGAIYPKTPEGQAVPLRKASLDAPLPAEFRLTPPVFYTPTFVLMEDGKELGRITGYIGDDAFWGLLGKMIRDIDAKKRTGNSGG